MKKTLFLSLMAALTLGTVATTFTSCNKKKDWTCRCSFGGTSQDFVLNDLKESDAKDACNTKAVSGFSCSLQ